MRERWAESGSDRYLLLTFDDPPLNLRSGWKESLSTFLSELKSLRAAGLSTFPAALSAAFDLLAVHRSQEGTETYAGGRSLFQLEPTLLLLLSDGGPFSSPQGLSNHVPSPPPKPHPSPSPNL